jgi:hypothetical protein
MGFKHRMGWVGATAAAALITACGGGGGYGGGSGPTAMSGTLSLSLTDAPACGYDHVNVTIQKIRVNQSGSASDSDTGWYEITLSPAKRVDLLTLRNGVLASLGQVALPAGSYTQMRLVLAANDSANPLLNSVVPSGGSETPLDLPSGVQTGLKTNIDISVAANQLADFVLDFNACKSVVAAGNSGKYLLKPVLSVVPNYVSGVSGYVDASLANGSTQVSVQQGGVVLKATAPDSSGRFVLAPVAPGSYDLVLTAPGRATEVVTGLTVASATVTQLNASSAPLAMPASLTATLSGTVNTGTSPIDASVRATQTLANGDKLEIVGGPVNASTGAYSEVLPVGPTMVAAFVAPQAALAFKADAVATARYGLEASGNGVVMTAGPLLLTAGATTVTNFSFP